MNTPRFWTRLLKWFCNNSFFEEIQGDLEEQYHAKLKKDGKHAAKAFYRKEVIFLIRPSVIKYIPFRRLVNWAFVLHAFKASFRNLKKHRAYSLLNIVGFAAAISICLFCVNAIYSNQQLDQKFEDKEFIYRVNTMSTNSLNTSLRARTPIRLYERIKEEIPEAKEVAIIQSGAMGFEAFLKGSKQALQVFSVNENFFEVLNYEVLYGNVNDIFKNKSNVVITKEMLDKYFKPESVIGQELGPYIISAVIETPAKVSHLDFDILATDIKDKDALAFYSSWRTIMLQQLYIKRYPESKEETIQAKLTAIAKEVNKEFEGKDIDLSYDFRLEPLKDVASSNADMNQGTLLGAGGQRIIWILVAILLGVCSFNYTNLAMASAIARTKEVAVRKVMGSLKSALVLQFLAETIILSLIAYLFGLILFKWLAPKFATFSEFYFNTNLSLNQVAIFFLFTLGMSLISGIIPGLIFSNISALQLFRKTKKQGKLSLMHLKKGMIVIQMTIGLFVFIVGYFIYNQAALISKQDNALVNEDYIAVQLPKYDSANIIFKNELQRIKGIENVVTLEGIPLLQTLGATYFEKQHNKEPLRSGVELFRADQNILKLIDPHLKWFSQKPEQIETPFFLANRLLIEQASDTIKNIREGFYSLGNDEYLPVLGSVDNLFGNQAALDPVPAAILIYPEVNSSSFYLELSPEGRSETIDAVAKLYRDHYPGADFLPFFLDDILTKNLGSFKNAIKAILFVLSSIIVITLMGQIGMSMYMARSKEKEIGIRKVLGASFNQIVNLILRSTYIQLIIGALVASPLAYLFYTNAGPSFTVQMQIGIEHFLIGLGLFSLVIIGLITVQTWGTTNAQPAETLRNE